MAEEKSGEEQGIQIHVPSDLEYCYRDMFNVQIGAGDVVIEFGNQHRGRPGHVSIGNRIAMTVGGAYQLTQTLQKALQAAEKKLQAEMRKAQDQSKS